MQFIGFCEWWTTNVEYEGQTVKVLDPDEIRQGCYRPLPKFLTRKEIDALPKNEVDHWLAERTRQSDEWHKNPWLDEEHKALGTKMHEITENMYEETVALLQKTGWRFDGFAHQDWYTPVFEQDGKYYKLSLSMRAWGGLVADAEMAMNVDYSSCREGYEYMRWYLSSDANESVYPPDNLLLKTLSYKKTDSDITSEELKKMIWTDNP